MAFKSNFNCFPQDLAVNIILIVNLTSDESEKTLAMKLYSFTKIITVIFFISFSIIVEAQVSEQGIPKSISFQLDNNYEKIILEEPDLRKIQEEDLINEAAKPSHPQRMGVSVMVNKSISNSGTWTNIEGIGSVWRLELKVDNALALGVYYNKFYIPDGGELYLYNQDKSKIIGAYTSNNNPNDNLFATEFIPGDVVILEYFKPANIKEEAVIEISELAYAYRMINFLFDKGTDSWWCMINVACEEGQGWEDQIKGIARMSIKIGWSFYWCSGSLINNTENDRTPYFLSAAHCGEGSNASDRNQWIFYFNYQASTCNGTSSGSNSITGCQLKARDGSFADDGSDFDLVEFNTAIPDYYDVYYNGWNRTNSNEDAGSGVGIHHPDGDIKKISTYDTPLQPSTFWNGLPSHWKLIWAETVNGKSIMQGGSSGSPVFDNNGLIMGDLTGGYASNSCNTPSPAYYGKIWYSWDQNGTTSTTQLKPWLDPDNTGIEKLPGVSWEIIPPTADYEASSTDITQGETVIFTDLSDPGILSWEWVFEGGEPSTSTEKNPHVIYQDTGYFTVSLTVVNADGTDTEIKSDYIHVQQMQIPDAEFEANATIVETGAIVYFSDLSINNPTEWEWIFEGASPSTSSQQNPIVRYNDPGIFDVTLVASNLGGSDTLIKEDYIHVSVVGVKENIFDNVDIYPNPNHGHFTIDFKNSFASVVDISVNNSLGQVVKYFREVNTTDN